MEADLIDTRPPILSPHPVGGRAVEQSASAKMGWVCQDEGMRGESPSGGPATTPPPLRPTLDPDAWQRGVAAAIPKLYSLPT